MRWLFKNSTKILFGFLRFKIYSGDYYLPSSVFTSVGGRNNLAIQFWPLLHWNKAND